MFVPIKKQNNDGFIALITAILISVSLLILTTAVSFEGYHSRFSILESQQKEQSSYLAEACVHIAILELSQDLTFNGTGVIPVGSNRECELISIQSGTFPSIKEIRAQGISGNAYTNLYVEASYTDTSPTVDILLWEEVATH